MSSARKQLLCFRRTPLPGNVSTERWKTKTNSHGKLSTNTDIKTEVQHFLIKHPNVLESIVLDLVDEDKLETLLQRKRDKRLSDVGVRQKLAEVQKRYTGNSVQRMATALLDKAVQSASECAGTMCHEQLCRQLNATAHIIANGVRADNFTLYIPTNNERDLEVCREDNDGHLVFEHYGPVGLNMTVAAHAAAEKKTLVIDNLGLDRRFPKGLGATQVSSAHSVMCIPIVLLSGDIIGVIQTTRNGTRCSFSANDIQLANIILGWMAAFVYEIEINNVLLMQQKLNEFLLKTTKVIFDEMTSIDILVQNIMMFTKKLVHADRCALFLLDQEKHELFADYFDEGLTAGSTHLFSKKSQIRFSEKKGIAGYVAKTGEVVNIYDAYEDPRFNRDIDAATGYKTKNVLCMPIISKDKIIGVVQMVNSLSNDHFTRCDESAFLMFAVYCALSLHYSRLYLMMHEQQVKYKVALEVMQFHIACTDQETKSLIAKPLPEPGHIPTDYTLYNFNCYLYEDMLPELFVYSMVDFFGADKRPLDLAKLCRFTVTIKKNYRPVVYHNWFHGFNVAHAVWLMVTRSPEMFTWLEKIAMFVAGICHDVDHRGYNNAFFKKMNLPMASLYSTSVMEQHHYKHAVTILQDDSHNILSSLSAEEYKEVLEMIRYNIMATDLELYFPLRASIDGQLKNKTFDITNPATKKQVTSLMMTGADLSAICKPWDQQQRIADMIYDEFYMQGDEERKHGIEPIPMMDREKKKDMPKNQVGFIKFVGLPLYKTLYECVPATLPLLDGAKANLAGWEREVEMMQQ